MNCIRCSVLCSNAAEIEIVASMAVVSHRHRPTLKSHSLTRVNFRLRQQAMATLDFFCSHECLFVLICSVSVVNSVAPTWQTFHSEQSVSDSCLSIFPWTPFAQLTAFLVTKCQIISYKRQVLLDVLLVLCPVLALNLELPSFCS